MAEMTLRVSGMTCNHCKMAVEKELNLVAGVEKALVNLEKGDVTISYSEAETGKPQFIEAIDEAGFDLDR